MSLGLTVFSLQDWSGVTFFQTLRKGSAVTKKKKKKLLLLKPKKFGPNINRRNLTFPTSLLTGS